MDWDYYMTYESEWKHNLGLDPDTRLPVYSEPETIMCCKYGKLLNERDAIGGTVVNANVYLTISKIKVLDMIDGQVVRAVNFYPHGWDPDLELYEVFTWET